MSKSAISLMNGMLQMDPKQRLVALEALAHSYFDSIRDDEVNDLISSNKESIRGVELPVSKQEQNRSRDLSKRKTSIEKQNTENVSKNPYSLPIASSPPQIKKNTNNPKKPLNMLSKDRKGSNSIKNLLQGRQSSKEVSGKRNAGMSSYDNTAYSGPKNKRNIGNNDALRENQSMGNYIASSFNGVFLQNVKNTQDTEYDYEIGGDFGPKGKNIPNKLDNSMGLPSQVYGTEELKNSISSSFSGFQNKEHKKISSLSPSNRSEENKTNFKNYNTNLINKVVNHKIKSRMRPAYEIPSGDSSQLESISETTMERHEK